MSRWRFSQRLATAAPAPAVQAALVSTPGSSLPAALLNSPAWEILRALDAASRLRADAVDARIADLAKCLAADRPTLLALLFRPQDALAVVPERANRPTDWTPELWLWMCWLAEATWLALDRISVGRRVAPRPPCTRTSLDSHASVDPDPPPARGVDQSVDFSFTASDVDLLRPLAARLRMIALTEPVRAEVWRIEPVGRHRALVTQAFGADTLHELVARAQHARSTWLGLLDTYQSHPLLAGMAPEDLEREVRLVLFTDDTSTPLVLSAESYLAGGAQPRPHDIAVTMEAVERHLLPRMMVTQVVGLASRIRYGRPASALAVAAALIAIAATVAGWQEWHPTGPRPAWYVIAAVAATTAYVVIAGGSWWLGQLWAAQWLLRLPAAAAVGLFVLVTLNPAWIYQGQNPAPVLLLLPAAAMGYLLVEAGNHGVSRRAAIGRAALVTAGGAVHALLISLIGLVLVAPVFVEDGSKLSEMWRAEHSWPAQRTLLLAGAWCLAVGVFSQILWDDRPITAPLAHLSWRDGR